MTLQASNVDAMDVASKEATNSSLGKDELDAEIVVQFRQQLKTVLAINVVVCAGTSLLFLQVTPVKQVSLWALAVLTLVGIRVIHALRLPDRENLTGHTEYWKTSFGLLSGF